MAKRGIISLDLLAMTGIVPGGPTLQMGTRLLRADKAALERHLAGTLAVSVAEFEGKSASYLRSCVPDPPDVLVNYDTREIGIEVAELLPPNRLEKDGIIARMRREIVGQLHLGEQTTNLIFQIFFWDDYATDFRPGRIGPAIGKAVNEFCNQNPGEKGTVPVPNDIADAVALITFERQDLSVDPRIAVSNEPLLIFGTQATLLCPEDDCPQIVATVMDRKCVHSVAMPTWLLLWTEHHAICPILEDMRAAITDYLQQHTHPYERVFHLHLGSEKGVVEFRVPNIQSEQAS
jgi:hypothetical protein